MKKPESVVSVNNDVLVGISSYDAFVYEYTNIENGKKYVVENHTYTYLTQLLIATIKNDWTLFNQILHFNCLIANWGNDWLFKISWKMVNYRQA